MNWLFHNLVGHPIAGVLWALGFDFLGDWVHFQTLPKEIKEENDEC